MNSKKDDLKIRKAKSPFPIGIDNLPDIQNNTMTIQVMMPDGTVITKIEQFSDDSEGEIEVYYDECIA